MSLTFRAAIREALDEELERDERVIIFGEDIAAAGGVFQVTPGLLEKWGPGRIFDTPISELALSAAAFGSAVAGLRPVIEIMFADFLPLAMDSLVNQSAKYWYLSNEQTSVPLVVRASVGGGAQFGAIHSQVPIPWFHAVPGIKLVCPSTPTSAKQLLKAAIRDPNPVLFLEHKGLYGSTTEYAAPKEIGEAAIVRNGRDLTLVTLMKSVHDALAAAAAVSLDGIEVEVIDLGSIRPLDVDTVLASVTRTSRLMVVEEGPLSGGWAGEVVAVVAERALGSLDDVWRLATPDMPIPYSPPLESEFFASSATIEESIREHIPIGVPVADA